MTDQAQSGWQLQGTSADAYEEFLVPPIFAPWAEALVDLADLRPGQRALDVACGTGAVARAAARRVGASGAVTGVDVNDTMLATARRVADDQIEWRTAEAGDLPFADGSFEVALCQQGMQFFPDRLKVARELHRVLTPTGRLAVAVWRGIDHSPVFARFAEALARHAPAAGDGMRTPFAFGGQQELRGLLADAGFARVRVVIDTRLSRFPSPAELLRQESLASPIGDTIAGLNEAARGALVADVEESLADFVDDDGLAVSMTAHLAIADT